MYNIKHTDLMGRCLFAVRTIPVGQVVAECELLVFSPEDTIKVNDTDLKFYTFKYNDTQDCLCLGDGELFNHSHKPNVTYELVDFEGRKIMRFTAIKEISMHEQLFINYTKDCQVNTDKYNVNMVG